MSFENIRQTVIKTAETEAQRIISVAKKQVEQQLASGKKVAREESERLYEARSRSVDEEYSRKVIQLKGRIGKEILEQRNARLREIFELAGQRILDWPGGDYKAVMQRLIEQAVGQRGGALRVHGEDVAVFIAVADEVNKHRDPDNRLRIDVEQHLPERGGFVFVSTDFEIDQSLRTILNEIEHELLPAIAKELFPE